MASKSTFSEDDDGKEKSDRMCLKILSHTDLQKMTVWEQDQKRVRVLRMKITTGAVQGHVFAP